ncbi:DUF4402 domain-containing protein [Tsukamurella sp. 1534]|uniref:DUF4402 domain-containing protein n=1 Tax=Tsukamurella sp. 1534 TaxID=1151061 RepID=UPI000316CEB0|nr:DUF4402 domain-containing protein [Tsukamurella sp. 1534]
MPVATITLESIKDGVVVDTVVVSAPDTAFIDGDIVLDTDPKGVYDTDFTVRTLSGAFQPGGRIVGDGIPIREMVLPFWLTPASRPRFQRLWGTPGNFRKVRYHYDGPSGRRTLTLRLAKQIAYETEDGFDAAVDDVYHAVVSAIAVNPMFEGAEDVSFWENPNDRFLVSVTGAGGTFTLTYSGQTTAAIAYNAAGSAVKSALEALSTVGAGNVTVSGTPGFYIVQFTAPTGDTLTGDAANLTGTGKKVEIKGASIGWFEVWNPTDQDLWLEWALDPALEWQFPDFAFEGAERKYNRPVGSDSARMIVTPELTQLLSVMADPFMDTYVNADLSNAAGLFNGVEPVYPVPQYTGTDAAPILMPVICNGPAGAKATLTMRRFWSAESGLEQP